MALGTLSRVTVRPRRFALSIATLILLGLPGAADAATPGATQRLIQAYTPITMLREEQDPPCETSAEQYEPTSVSTVLGNPSVRLLRVEEDGKEVLVEAWADGCRHRRARVRLSLRTAGRPARRHLRLRA